MRYLIDSDWVIDRLGGKQAALELFRNLASDGIAISVVTYGEVYDGFALGPDPLAAEAGFQRLLIGISVLPIEEAIIRRFFRVRRQLRQQGTPLEDLDLQIAATALHHGLTLVTRNRRHYDRIPGLKLYP